MWHIFLMLKDFLAVLGHLALCVDVAGADGVDGVFDGMLESLISLTEVFLHWQLKYCNGFLPYVNCCLHDIFFVVSNEP